MLNPKIELKHLPGEVQVFIKDEESHTVICVDVIKYDSSMPEAEFKKHVVASIAAAKAKASDLVDAFHKFIPVVESIRRTTEVQ